MEVVAHLLIGDEYRPAEDDPLHHLAAGWGGEGADVAVVATQRRRQQVPQNEGLQERLFLCMRKESRKRIVS